MFNKLWYLKYRKFNPNKLGVKRILCNLKITKDNEMNMHLE